MDFGESKSDYDLVGEEFGVTLDRFKNVVYATFFDLLEDNMLDILIVTDTPGSGRKINGIFNNIDRGNFFLKVRMVSDEAAFSAVRGAAMRMVTTMLDDHKIIV